MHDTNRSEKPKDSDKLGYKFLLDSLREQLLRERSLLEEPPKVPTTPTDGLPEGKKYFRVREVAEILKVEPYVLRYWENEFGFIRPKKSRSGQRIYDRKDLKQLKEVHRLLYIEKFSLQGAKKQFQELRRARREQNAQRATQGDVEKLKRVARDVRELITWIEGLRL
jgi:DNA-binding transcriptional MerR regulator